MDNAMTGVCLHNKKFVALQELERHDTEPVKAIVTTGASNSAARGQRETLCGNCGTQAVLSLFVLPSMR